MGQLPRVAVGTVQPQADGTAMLWGLMSAMTCAGLRVQSFLSRAYFTPRDGATAITGLSPRHLDGWIMSDRVCREVFVRGSQSSDLSMVEGRFEDPRGQSAAHPARLETLCQWLDLPKLVTVDVRQLGQCRLPHCPPAVSGLLLDRVANTAERVRVKTILESLWNVPVIGWLGALEDEREAIERIPSGTQPPLELCHALGEQFIENASVERIVQIAGSRTFEHSPRFVCSDVPAHSRRLCVAVAYDDAFRGYFPDTLDLLESRGATVCEFSPLSDDRLPAGSDVVYFGCGHPERFLTDLSRNECMLQALKNHLCSGRRMYAECGGLAYLCREIRLPDGRSWPMVGVFDLVAEYQETTSAPAPVELTLRTDTWLTRSGTRTRGYLNPRWKFTSEDAREDASLTSETWNLFQRHQALGSRAYLDFAAQPELLEGFFRPHVTSPATPRAGAPLAL